MTIQKFQLFSPSFPSNSSRSAGVTRVPINLVARISFSWGNKAGFIINVILEMRLEMKSNYE